MEAVIAVDFILSFKGDKRLSGYGAVNINPTLGVITVGINPRTRNIVLVGKNSNKSFPVNVSIPFCRFMVITITVVFAKNNAVIVVDNVLKL